MLAAILLLLVQPAGSSGNPYKNPAERLTADAIKVWMGCLAPQVAEKKFGRRSEADAAADAAFQACTREEDAVRTALSGAVAARRVDPTMADMRIQFRNQVRDGAIKRRKS
jgi:hypothetical protein